LFRPDASGRPDTPGRDEQGRIGLLDLHCSHRGTDLSYGRIEDGGLRCVYHGWLYDVAGTCLETPAEPAGSHLKEFVRHRSYPCVEKGGVIFTYMGPGEPPLLPNYEVLSAPPDHRVTTKYLHECNYLQGLEGNMDNVHVQYLHSFLRTESGARKLDEHPKDMTEEDRRTRGGPPRDYSGPVRFEETDFGNWGYYAPSGAGRPDFIFPSLCFTQGGAQAHGDGYLLYWRVPVDDTHHWLFALSYKRSGPIPEEHRYQRTWALMTPDYRFTRNQQNRYLQDREEQRTGTFTGMGSVFVVQDALANETQGPIFDRTREMLGVEDMMIGAGRRMLLRAIRTVQEGGEPPGRILDPRVNEVDPLFLKRNAPPSEGDLQAIRSELGGRWIEAPAHP
jgi:phenylpropionate dioxygenase-like ring-hydroxylating dioxygenase large terminal subunit